MQCGKAGEEGSAGQAKFVSLKREQGAAMFPGEDVAGVGECQYRATCRQGVGSCTKLIWEQFQWSQPAYLGNTECDISFVKEGKQLVMQHQKWVRLADRSDHRWLVVNEYETDELAGDEDDERRISKALKNAEKRVEAVRKRREVEAGRSQVELVLERASSRTIGRPV